MAGNFHVTLTLQDNPEGIVAVICKVKAESQEDAQEKVLRFFRAGHYLATEEEVPQGDC